jgi:O-antigen/teichoic acid export membrane protein
MFKVDASKNFKKEFELAIRQDSIILAYASAAISRGFDLGAYYLLFKYFAIEEVSLYSWALACAAVFSAILDFGLNQLLTREFVRSSLTFSEGFWISTILRIPALILLGGYLAYGLFKDHFGPSEKTDLMFLCLVLQTLLATQGVIQSWYRSRRRQNRSSLLLALDPAAKLFSIILVIDLIKEKSAFHLILILVAIQVVVFVLNLNSVWKEFEQVPWSRLKNKTFGETKAIVRSALIFGTISLFTVLQNRGDWIIISNYSDKTDLASYAVANKFYEIIMTTIGVATLFLYPLMCVPEDSRRNQEKIKLISKLVVIGGGLVTILASIILPVVLSSLFDGKYVGAIDLSVSLACLIPFAAIVQLRYYFLVSRSAARIFLACGFLSTFLQITIDLLLIPTRGATGAVIGMCAMIASNLLMYSVISVIRFSLSWKVLAGELVVSLFSVLIAMEIRFNCFQSQIKRIVDMAY